MVRSVQKEIDDLVRLSHICRTQLDMEDAAEALDDLLVEREVVLPPLRFLSGPALLRSREVVGETGNPYFSHLPKTNWRMLVKFT